jgi:hypothetical protein
LPGRRFNLCFYAIPGKTVQRFCETTCVKKGPRAFPGQLGAFCRSGFSSGQRRLAKGIPQGTSERRSPLILAERCPALRVG